MDNPEKLAPLGTQDTVRRQTKQINVREHNGQSRETGTIGHLCSLTFICFVCRRTVSCVPNGASFSGLSIVFSNVYLFCLSDTVRRQTKQINVREHNGQSRETGTIGYTRHSTTTNKTNKR
jgi:hypothetical protein